MLNEEYYYINLFLCWSEWVGWCSFIMDIYWIKRPIPVGGSQYSLSALYISYHQNLLALFHPVRETELFHYRDTKTLLTEKPAEQLECTCRLAQVEAQTEKYTRSVRHSQVWTWFLRANFSQKETSRVLINFPIQKKIYPNPPNFPFLDS